MIPPTLQYIGIIVLFGQNVSVFYDTHNEAQNDRKKGLTIYARIVGLMVGSTAIGRHLKISVWRDAFGNLR